MRSPIALVVLVVLGGSIASAEGASVDVVTECVHLSPDGHYTYSYIVNERPPTDTVEMECAVFDNQRKALSSSQRTYEPEMSAKPRWNRRCVVVDEHNRHVFTRSENTFSVTRAAHTSSEPMRVVEDAPCSQRARTGPRIRAPRVSASRAIASGVLN
jgi:hypothetical protein